MIAEGDRRGLALIDGTDEPLVLCTLLASCYCKGIYYNLAGGPPLSAQALKEQQEQERRKALQHVANFLNPQNKPPAKTALGSGKVAASADVASKSNPSWKSKDDK